MKNNLAWALRLTVLSLATFVAQPVYADSQALRDLKIHIASVQQVLVDPKLADPQKRLQRRHLAVTILHQLFDFQEMSRRALGANARRWTSSSKDASSDWEQFKEILVMKCQRCFDDRRVVYRVSSDLINLKVCASCAAEARSLGLAVEVFSVGESKTLRARAK